eukprot:16439368-Heterocapsa_arctica.AAC.1
MQDTGKCPLSLYVPLRLLACEWKADVQELEGVNNMVAMACAIAPGISLALLDARVANGCRHGVQGNSCDQMVCHFVSCGIHCGGYTEFCCRACWG